MAMDPAALPEGATTFLVERHLATLTTHRPDGSTHVVPVGFSWDPAGPTVRVITSVASVKAHNLAAGGRAAVCQVDGGRWLTLEGPARVTTDPGEVADAVQRYAQRYQDPRQNPNRAAIVITVDRIMGRAPDS